MVEIPIIMNNKFQQLTAQDVGEGMDVVMSNEGHIVGVVEKEIVFPSCAVPNSCEGSSNSAGENASFVQTQVEKLDEGQKDLDLSGARAHFLPKSSVQGKSTLNVKIAERKPPKAKKLNPPHG